MLGLCLRLCAGPEGIGCLLLPLPYLAPFINQVSGLLLRADLLPASLSKPVEFAPAELAKLLLHICQLG